MVCLVDHDPVRAAGLAPHLLQAGEEGSKEAGAIVERDADQADSHVHRGGGEQLEHFLDRGRALGSADSDQALETLVVALGIDDAALVTGGHDPLQESGSGRGLAAARRAGDQQAPPGRSDLQLGALAPVPEQERMAGHHHRPEVILEHAVDQLLDPGSPGSPGHQVRAILEGVEGVGDGDAAFGRRQHRMIVLGVAHRDGVAH